MTKQDLEQIRRYFLEKGIKDTDLKKANPLDGTEIWGVVQGGKSVQASMKDFLIFLKPLIDQNQSLFCGFHTSEEVLKGLYPTAQEGSYAWVITASFPEYPGEVYTYSLLHGWVATGIKASDDTKVDLEDYIKSEEVEEIAKLPDYTATRTVCDASGNIIEDTYVRRDELINGEIKGDSYIPDFSTEVFCIDRLGVQSPGTITIHLRAVSGTGYVRDTMGMFVVSGIDESGKETLIGASENLSSSYSLTLSVSPYKYIKSRIYQDLSRTILIYEKTHAIVRDGINGKDGAAGKDGINGTNGTNGTNGINGTNGETPYIGSNNHWWIGQTDTGIVAIGQNGAPGKDGEAPTIEISDQDTWVINGVDTGKRTNGRPYLFTFRLKNNENMSRPLKCQGYIDRNRVDNILADRYNDMIRVKVYPTYGGSTSKADALNWIYLHTVNNIFITCYPLPDYLYTTAVVRSVSQQRDWVEIMVGLYDFNGNANNHQGRADFTMYVPSVLDGDAFVNL